MTLWEEGNIENRNYSRIMVKIRIIEVGTR
jgi:hypothetical protein